jgi:hypothetical protein
LKKVLSTDGNEKRSSMDVDAVLAKLRELVVNHKVAPVEFENKRNNDRSFNIFHGGCSLECCRMAQKDVTLRRPDGRMCCGATQLMTHFLKESTGCDWDHTILEFAKP